jgi:hypothetical protein
VPVLNDLGSFKTLVNDIQITATDDFTGYNSISRGKNNTTKLEGEKKYKYGVGRTVR